MGGLAAARQAFAKGGEPYAGGDIVLARKLDGIITAAGTAVGLILLPFAPPTAAIGNAGWFVAALVALVGCGSTVFDRRTGGRDWNAMLAWNYVGVAQIAAIQWLAGTEAPYRDLFVMSAVFAGAVHPPRRVVPFVFALNAITLIPLIGHPWDPTFFGSTIALIVIWTALALVSSVANTEMRLHRIRRFQAAALARSDALTGLGNRRAFDEALTEEIARARRLREPLSLLLADLNDFKEINDRYGHVAGDDCLRALAGTFREETRLHDRCFRWGGDEFAAILSGSDAADADLIARRLEQAVSERCRRPDGAPLTIGAAHAQLTDSMTAEDLVSAADAELLAAKRELGTGTRN
jgi:diguanylate cyclase (GGDEF)-like protein